MRKSDSVVFLVAGLLTVCPSRLTAGNLSAEADGIRAELSTDPERPARGQETTYELRLFDSAGKPLTGARVALHGRMADGMTVLAPLRQAPEPGIYRGRVLFYHGGDMGADAARERRGQGARVSADRAGRALTPAWVVGGSLGGVLILGIVGWVAWTQGALVGLRWVEFDAPLSLAGLGFLAGIGAFFAPCAFALFPGYVSYYLTVSGEDGGIRRSLGVGLACAAGSVVFFALVGAAITLAGGAISSYLIATKPYVALAVIGLGVVQVADVRMPSLALPRGLASGQGLPVGAAVFLYGFGYALASTGCTLPLYVSITVLPLTSGFSGAALLTFLAFAAAMAILMLVTTLLVGLAKQNLIRVLQSSAVWIKRGSGIVLILAGLYLGYYYVRAGM